MTRGRSKSIILKIASDVPSNLDDHLNLASQSTCKLTKSKSIDSISYSSTDIDGDIGDSNREGGILFPFTLHESNSIWSNYIETYEYDCILKSKDIENINSLQLDNVLNFQNNIIRNQQQISEYISQTDTLLSSISSLLDKYNQISNDTIEFDKEANTLLELQQTYSDKYLQINTYLKHFQQLDSITKNLSRSGNHLLRDLSIVDILQNIDESLMFINQHSNFKESELYGSRFRQCMTRGLTLIRNYLIQDLKSLSEGISRKLGKVNIELLIYNEFNNYDKGQFTKLFHQIVIRTEDHEEYNGLVKEILSMYFDIRLNLLKLYIDKDSNINMLYHKQVDLVQSCQDQISYFKKIIDKEFILFKQLFQQETQFINQEFYQFLKNLLEPLYDLTRLLVLKETSISNLCQLTTLLQKYYEFDNEEYFTETIKYGELFQPILDDCSNRLIFKIQKYVDDKLIKYKPKPKDLKIGNRRSTTNSTVENILDIEYKENLFPDVYLPLGKALTLLSNIYELINSIVFDDLAHYIVHSCIELLKGEFVTLASGYMGKFEGKLAYLNNLIILRSQINNFDIQYTRTDYSIDFTSGLNDIWQMIKNRQFNSGLIELAKKTVPKIINNMIDANLEIELELNNLVTEIITVCANEICESLNTEGNALEITSQFKDQVIIKLPIYYNQFKSILNDQAITQFLLNNLSNVILSKYETYYKQLTLRITDETRSELSEIMEVDAMYGFINDFLSHMFDEDVNVEFKQDILNNLQIDDELLEDIPENIDISPSPGTNEQREQVNTVTEKFEQVKIESTGKFEQANTEPAEKPEQVNTEPTEKSELIEQTEETK